MVIDVPDSEEIFAFVEGSLNETPNAEKVGNLFIPK